MSDVVVEKISAKDFEPLARDAHLVCFGDDRPADFNRFDYALIVHTTGDRLTAYSTILEHDADSAYMQHGGTLTEDKLLTVKSYLMMIKWLKERYPVITTRIFNDNIAMLKLAMQAGLRIHGVEYYNETKHFKGGILLNLKMENELCGQ
jgi:hypothetical protein